MSYKNSIPEKIMSREDLLRRINLWHLQNNRVVFTNGCFDLLHKGHVEYLMEAADHGDKLIIGLNSDDSVKLLNKGVNRPLQDEKARAMVLASLTFVSAVILFDEETPKQLIESLRPDTLVKGGDYEIHQIVGSDFVLKNGGQVKTIPIIEGYSTSNIEEKIKRF